MTLSPERIEQIAAQAVAESAEYVSMRRYVVEMLLRRVQEQAAEIEALRARLPPTYVERPDFHVEYDS